MASLLPCFRATGRIALVVLQVFLTAAFSLHGWPGAVHPVASQSAGPDLVVGPPTVDSSSPAAGAWFNLSATVQNQGTGRSASTTLRYYRSTDATITTGDTEVATDRVFRLDPAEGGAESVRLIAPARPGTYYYGACVAAVPGEADTANNCSAAVTVTVGAASAPNQAATVTPRPTPAAGAPAPHASGRRARAAYPRPRRSGIGDVVRHGGQRPRHPGGNGGADQLERRAGRHSLQGVPRRLLREQVPREPLRPAELL